MRFVFFLTISLISHAIILSGTSTLSELSSKIRLKDTSSVASKGLRINIIRENKQLPVKEKVTKQKNSLDANTKPSNVRNASLKTGFTTNYPRVAKRLGYEGEVFFRVLVGEKGNVLDVVILKSSGYEILDHQAKKDLFNTQFLPAKNYKGIFVRDWIKLSVNFTL